MQRALHVRDDDKVDDRYWTNASVRAFAGDGDPIDAVVERAREVVLEAMDEGWDGPPFDPFVLADRLGVPLIARQELQDARTVPVAGGEVRIEFNPTRPRGRLRFSVAHELAHTFFPDVAETVRYRSAPATTGDAWQLELLCNIAAAELLMPVGTFGSLASEPLDINHLMRLRKTFDVSTEALLRRVVRLTERPAAFFAASRLDGNRLDSDFRVEYIEASHAWRPHLPRGKRVPGDALLRSCTAVGYTETGVEHWSEDQGELEVQCVGVAPYPGHRYPRVVGLLSPRVEGSSHERAIHYVDGDATQPRGEGRRLIAHVVNDRTPNWGGAFARALKNRLPAAQTAFQEWVATDRSRLRLGRSHVADLAADISVTTMVAQRGYGPAAKPRIAYAALRTCLREVADAAAERGASVHMPRIGVGMAGGDWGIVSELIDDALVSRGLDVTVYSLPGAEFETGEQEVLQLSV